MVEFRRVWRVGVLIAAIGISVVVAFTGCPRTKPPRVDTPSGESFDFPRPKVWSAMLAVLSARYPIDAAQAERGIVATDWASETKDGLVYRSRVDAWLNGTGPYRVDLSVEMYVRAVSARYDMRTEKGEAGRARELYAAIRQRLGADAHARSGR